MANAVVSIHFKDMPVDEEVRDDLETRCQGLATEFPELTHVDVTLSTDGPGHHASGHVTGKSTEVASHAEADEPHTAADRLLDTLRAQLRRTHDKRIFQRRREAQKHHPRRE
jgi:ribosomal subunit interface protein